MLRPPLVLCCCALLCGLAESARAKRNGTAVGNGRRKPYAAARCSSFSSRVGTPVLTTFLAAVRQVRV